MNIINFYEYEKNSRYIKPQKIQYNGQGLYNSYFIEIFGNGFNKYIFNTEHNGKEYKIYFDEQHILQWTIKSHLDEESNLAENLLDNFIIFDGYGILRNEYFDQKNYFHFNSGGDDDFEHIYTGIKKFKIIDITIENNNSQIEIINNITNEYDFRNSLDEKQQKINQAIEDKKNYYLSTRTKVNYTEWINNYDTNRTYYFIIDSDETIIPFKVINIEHNIKYEYDDIMDAVIYYEDDNEYQVKITMSHFVELDDEFNIDISFEIKSDEKVKEIFEYCYIVEEKIEN